MNRIADQFVCHKCGFDNPTAGKLAVCLRNFDGVICQTCGTITTQAANAEFCKRIENLIDELVARNAQKPRSPRLQPTNFEP